jgi:hypothetical protein
MALRDGACCQDDAILLDVLLHLCQNRSDNSLYAPEIVR